MTTRKQVQEHIRSLIAQDKRDKSNVGKFYEQALTIIKNSLNAFFVQYASETGLDYNTLAQQANSWDLQQFQDAINLMMNNMTVDNDLDKRLLSAKAMATIDKRNSLLAIVTATTAIATAKTQNYGNSVAVNMYKQEHKRVVPDKPVIVPKEIEENKDFNSKVWVNNDIVALRTRQAIDKAIHKTIDKPMLRRMTANNHGRQLTYNLDSASQAGISFNKSLINDTSINVTNSARDSAFKNDETTDYVVWCTDKDDKVCDICNDLEGSVYEADDITKPVPIDDTHNNCRCIYEPCDKDGNLI